MKTTAENVDEYLDGLDDPEMIELATLIGDRLPGIEPQLWRGTFWGGTEQTIIGYGHLTYTRSDKKQVEWFMVGLARQKNHLSLYISARGDNGYLANEYADRLGKVKVGAGRLSFAHTGDVNHQVLGELLEAVSRQITEQ